jgi:hypothetical protein
MSNNKQTNFEVFCLQTITEDKMYTHWSEGLSMYIVKDGTTIKLNSEEVKQLVKSLPKTIGGTY